MKILKITGAFVLATAAAEVIAATLHASFVLAALQDIGVVFNESDLFAMILHDIPKLVPTYGILIGIGFLIAFPVATLIIKRFPGARTLGYTLAGAAAIIFMILLMNSIFDMTPLAVARTSWGILCQGLAGAVGGYLFALTLPVRKARLL